MQGVSAYIETHYEAMSYWKQEKKICHFMKTGICDNKGSVQYMKKCIGYTKCADFISKDRYEEKLAKLSKKNVKQKKSVNVKHKNMNKKLSKNFSMDNNKAIMPITEKKMSENAIGNDPRLKDIFEQFKQI